MTKHKRTTQPAGETQAAPKPHRRSIYRQASHYIRLTIPFLHKIAKRASNSSLPAILLISAVLLARYMPNSDFSYPSEIFLPIALFSILATASFYFYRWTFRGKSNPAHVATFLLIYALYGFAYAFPYVQKWTDAILPSSLTTGFSSAFTRIVLLAVIFWIVAYLIDLIVRKVKLLHHFQPYKVMLFAVCFIFIVQFAKVAIRTWTIRHQLAYSYNMGNLPAKPADTPDLNNANKPNVYYLVFDRYASQETLQRVYNYDNSDFVNFLIDEGFVLRKPAYANYPFTQQSISSTLSMDYLTDLETRFKNDALKFQTAFPYRNIIRDPPAAKVFQQNGYHYNQVSSWWDYTRFGINADSDPVKSFRLRTFGLAFWLTDLERDIFYRSALSPILQKGITVGSIPIIKYDQDRNPRQNFYDQMAALQNIARASKAQKQPQFTFAHVLSPHDPYIFAADGSNAPYDGNRTDQDVDEYTKYTNQLTYVNTQIKKMLTTIRQQDPNAVIIFQPDEGPYPKQFRGQLSENNYFDPKNLDDGSMRHKLDTTTAYYMPGLDTDTTHLLQTSANAFPFVLNNYLGYDIPYLPECNFSSGNKFVLYDYSLITGRLHGTANPEDCKQFDR